MKKTGLIQRSCVSALYLPGCCFIVVLFSLLLSLRDSEQQWFSPSNLFPLMLLELIILPVYALQTWSSTRVFITVCAFGGVSACLLLFCNNGLTGILTQHTSNSVIIVLCQYDGVPHSPTGAAPSKLSLKPVQSHFLCVLIFYII